MRCEYLNICSNSSSHSLTITCSSSSNSVLNRLEAIELVNFPNCLPYSLHRHQKAVIIPLCAFLYYHHTRSFSPIIQLINDDVRIGLKTTSLLAPHKTIPSSSPYIYIQFDSIYRYKKRNEIVTTLFISCEMRRAT